MNNKKHRATLRQDKTFRKLFSDEEIENIRAKVWIGCSGIKNKGYWIMNAGSDKEFKVFTERGVVKCEKIDVTKGPFQ